MKKLNPKQKILIGTILGILVIGIICTCVFLGKKEPQEKDNNNDMNDSQIVQDVSPDEATGMYDTLTEKCTGALVWNLELGQTIEIDNLENTNACQNDNHYSKMIGYTYDEQNNVVIHVNILKKVENSLYKLDNTLVGEFKEEELNNLLDQGTTYVYTYKKVGENYKLENVKLMDPVPEETVE